MNSKILIPLVVLILAGICFIGAGLAADMTQPALAHALRVVARIGVMAAVVIFLLSWEG